MEKYNAGRKASEFLTKNEIIQKIFENDLHAVIVTDKWSVIELVNPGFTKLFGYTAREAVGKSVNELIVHEKSDADLGKTRKAYQDKHKSIRSRKSGKRISVLNHLIPIMEGNETIGSFAYYRGIGN